MSRVFLRLLAVAVVLGVLVFPPNSPTQIVYPGGGSSSGGGGASNFGELDSGTNTNADMVVGTGATLGYEDDGTIDASHLGGTAAASYPTLTSTSILTNKQYVPRVVIQTVVSNEITTDIDTTDIAVVDSLAGDLTINAPTGTGSNPRNGQELIYRFKTAAPRSLIWNAIFTAENGLTIPTGTTGDGTTYDYVKFIYNSTSSKWGLVATTKGVQRGVTTLSSSTTYTCNIDLASLCEMQMTEGAGTLTVAQPTGTPTNGQLVRLGFLCTNAQTFSFNAIFIASPNVAIPTTCPADTAKWTLVGAQYSTVLTKWQIIATN